MIDEYLISFESMTFDRISIPLLEYNWDMTLPESHIPLNVFARTRNGEIVGNLLGETCKNWLYVIVLWVQDVHRNTGLGSRLLIEAEMEALQRGCCISELTAHNIHSEKFYLKNGYAILDIPDNFQPEQKRISMRKFLKEDYYILKYV